MADRRRLKFVMTAEDRASPVFSRVAGAVRTLGVVAAAVGASALAGKLVRGLGAAVKAAAEQEKAEIRLSQAIANTGANVSKVLPQLREQAGALQRLTGIGDELILSNQALLVSIGQLSGEGLERATRAALDLAEVQQIDTKTAFELVAKAAAGYTSTLSRYGIILDESIPKGERFEAALRQIEERFGGAAQSSLQGYTKRVSALQGAFGDIQETIGGPVKDVLSAFIGNVLTPLALDLNQSATQANAFQVAALRLGISLGKLGEVGESLLRGGFGQFLLAVGVNAFVKFQRDVELLNSAFEKLGFTTSENTVLFGAFVDELEGKLEKLLGGEGGIPEVVERTVEWNLELQNLTTGALDEETGLPGIARTVAQINEQTTFASDVWRGWSRDITDFGVAYGELLDTTGQVITGIRTLGNEISANLQVVGRRSAMQFGSTLVDAALEGKRAFSDFFKQLLRDLARAIAQALILRALTGTKFGNFIGLQQGGIVPKRAQSGLFVTGGTPGKDSVPILATPGEAVLPKELVDYILRGGPNAGLEVHVEMGPNMRRFADELNVEVRRGGARLLASELVAARAVR